MTEKAFSTESAFSWIDKERVAAAQEKAVAALRPKFQVDRPLRLAIFASGRGTNAEALIRASQAGDMPSCKPLLVLSDKNCRAIARARDLGVGAFVLLSADFPNRRAQEEAIEEVLEREEIDLLALAGYMRLLTAPFVEKYEGRILNIHPALLPAYPGTEAIERAYAAGEAYSGVTIHLVDQGTDTGPRLAQAKVARQDRTLDEFEQAIHEAEHLLYPATVNRYAKALYRQVVPERRPQ